MKFRSLRLAFFFICTLLGACMRDQPEAFQEVAVQGVYSASLSEDANYALVGSINHGGSLWQTSDMERRYNWNLSKDVYSDIHITALSRNGLVALTGDARQAVFWDTRTGKSIGYWGTPADIKAAALSRNGAVAIFGLRDYSAIVVDVTTGNRLHRFNHQGMVGAVSLSGDGKLALSGSDDRRAKLWDLSSGQLLHEWNHSNTVNLVELSNDGELAISSSQHTGFYLWDTKTGKQKHFVPNRSHTITAATFSQDKRQLLLGTSLQEISLWQTANAKRMQRWKISGKNAWQPSNTKVYAVAFSQNSHHFFSLTSNGILQKWAL